MTEEFGGDVLLFDTEDGGEISVINGLVINDGGFRTAVYLSLFGGNKDDGGEVASGDTWWGNRLEGVSENEKLVSRFMSFVRSVPLNSKNLKIAQDKAEEDLKWFLDDDIADSVEVELMDEGNNRIQLNVRIEKSGEIIESGKYALQWEAVKNGV